MAISPISRYAQPYADTVRVISPPGQPSSPIQPSTGTPSSTRDPNYNPWADQVSVSTEARSLLGRATSAASQAQGSQSVEGGAAAGKTECKTCSERKYQDESDDPSVSFQSAQHLSPETAASAVQSHESEHVRNEQGRAQAEGKEVVHQSVAIHTATCPECGRVYVSGGTTTTQTLTRAEPKEQTSEGRPSLNMVA